VSREGLERNSQVLQNRHTEPHISSTYIPPTEEDEKEIKVHTPKFSQETIKEKNKHHSYNWTRV
jgi:hypothetical protein